MNKRGLWLLAISGLVFITGCTTQVTKEHFSMIKVGVDDKEDVRRILGPEYEEQDSFVWRFKDQYGEQRVYVIFDDRGVVQHAEWIGGADVGVFERPENHEGETIHQSSKVRTIDP